MSMFFKRVSPAQELLEFVECYWIVEDDDNTKAIQKIIPDGFTEIIFHYRDPYRINLHGDWEIQDGQLFCGQISQYFALENTGASGMMGIKFKPTALARLFNISMHDFTDKVVPLQQALGNSFASFYEIIKKEVDHDGWINAINAVLIQLVNVRTVPDSPADVAVNVIHTQHGMLTVAELCDQLNTSERNLERAFRQHVGLSPKFYTRLIRFARIFQLIREHREEGAPWSDLVHKLGYYDQPHFIRNFKAFTGEEPSGYFFDHPTLANFFLVK